MRASADKREWNEPKSNQRNDAVCHIPSIDSNSTASYKLPRLVGPSAPRTAWQSQQSSPSLARVEPNPFTTRRRDEDNDGQMQRLPGIQALLSTEVQLNLGSPYGPSTLSCLPPFTQITSGCQLQETARIASGSGRANSDSSTWSLPSSPYSNGPLAFVQPQQHLPIREDGRVKSIPVDSNPHQGGVATVALKTEFERSRLPRPTPDYQPRPTCVGKREIEGEGSCWVFADGTYCRTVVDGEPVNPSWGVTKAGKARKRLAQACLTCREKKIKCEPGLPKCTQCEKTGRVCRR